MGLSNTGFSGTGIRSRSRPAAPYAAGQNVTLTIAHDYPLLFGLVTGLPEVPFRVQATMVVLYAP